MSWKAEMHTEGQWVSNSLCFATEAEALAYGKDLFNRWFVPDDYRAVESDEPVNYRIIDGYIERIES